MAVGPQGGARVWSVSQSTKSQIITGLTLKKDYSNMLQFIHILMSHEGFEECSRVVIQCEGGPRLFIYPFSSVGSHIRTNKHPLQCCEDFTELEMSQKTNKLGTFKKVVLDLFC